MKLELQGTQPQASSCDACGWLPVHPWASASTKQNQMNVHQVSMQLVSHYQMKCFFSCQTVTYMSGHPPLNIQVLGATQAHSLTHSPKHQTSSWCHPGLLTHPLTQTSYPRDPLSLAYFNLLRSLSSGCACWSGPFLGTQIFTQVLQSMVAWMPRVGKGYMFNIILMAREQSNLEWTTYLAMITKPTKSELQTCFTRTPQVNQCSFSFECGPRHLFLSWFFFWKREYQPSWAA